MSNERPNRRTAAYSRQKELTGLPLRIDIARTHWQDDLDWWSSEKVTKKTHPM